MYRMNEIVFSSIKNTSLPQNIDAEESILGGIMLDPGAMGRVVDLVTYSYTDFSSTV